MTLTIIKKDNKKVKEVSAISFELFNRILQYVIFIIISHCFTEILRE